ncbi:MAG TPA: HAD-IIB family hydrolase, partial [Bacillota bacterium]|nr:HAD-IIB family hydrolase [Bacillota bacterium]
MGLIAIDMDGTLINNQHDISQENIKAIQMAQVDGYEVVIATGRAHFDAQKILEGAGLSLYTIGANGSTAHSPSGTNILSVEMSKDKVKDIVGWLDDVHLYYELFCDDGIYTPKDARGILYKEIEDLRHTAIKSEIDFMSFHLEKQLSQSGFMF